MFGLFKDEVISSKQFTLFFVLKCLAVPAFYWVYKIQYGGIENFDAGIYFKDAQIINSIAYDSFSEYLKILFGFQSDDPSSYIHAKYIVNTANWDEGFANRLFFNDNRSVIRIHSVLHFISFHNYFVHALFSCLMGYVGIYLIYRSLKHLFISKETWVMAAFVFLPNLWLFSGALLKEPILLMNMGLIFYLTDQLFKGNVPFYAKSVSLFFSVSIIFFLKPQVAAPVFVMYLLYHVSMALRRRRRAFIYVGLLVLTAILLNGLLNVTKNTSLLKYINSKQAEFVALMNGGIFLKDNEKFVRLEYDNSRIIVDTTKAEANIRIKSNTPYQYWMDVDQKQMRYCPSNTDTSRLYTMKYVLTPARSTYPVEPLTADRMGIETGLKGIYHAMFYPIKFNSAINALVSLENIFLMVCLVIAFVGLIRKKRKIDLIFFLSIILFFAFLFGTVTPNTGAIVRYRSLMIPFLVLAAIYAYNKPYETREVR